MAIDALYSCHPADGESEDEENGDQEGGKHNNSKVLLGSMAPATTMMMLTMINNHYVEYDSWMTQQIHTVPVDEPSPTHTKSILATRPKL